MYLKDDKWRLICGIADYYGVNANMMGEVKALFQGVRHCWDSDAIELDVKSNSKVLVPMLHNKVSLPWSILYEIGGLNSLLIRCTLHVVSHVYI